MFPVGGFCNLPILCAHFLFKITWGGAPMCRTEMLDGDYMVTCICRQIKFSCLYACIRRCILNINMRHVEIIFLVGIATLWRTTYLILNATVIIGWCARGGWGQQFKRKPTNAKFYFWNPKNWVYSLIYR